MGKILSAIGAALRALGHIVWVPCRATGRMIMKIVDFGGSAPAPAATASQSSQRPSQGAEVISLAERQAAKLSKSQKAITTLAGKMAYGSVQLSDMHDVPAEVVQWLSQLDHIQLCRITCIEDMNGYMSGRREVRGLPKYMAPIYRPANERTQDYEPECHGPISAPAI